MSQMTEKLATLWPEMALLVGACLSMLVGLSSSARYRKTPAWVAAGSLLVAAWLTWHHATNAPSLQYDAMVMFIKMTILTIGLLLVLVAAGVPDAIAQTRDMEARTRQGEAFDSTGVMRGEFFAFFLFSITGAMLCAGANDLVWLFLALELTSLPTYVMVAISRDQPDAQESAVKYFFLGAMAAAVFLYGFALLYGATGSTRYDQIAAFLQAQTANGEPASLLLIAGFVLSIIGLSFKIAAVPMHFYVADVYQGAAAPVTAFLAFVPKTAGFVSLFGLLTLAGHLSDDQREPLLWLLWIMAALTMTIGNVLGLLQDNVKRVLAYSSIAHSGYMLVGLLAVLAAAGGPTGGQSHLGNGAASLLFYLVAYGLATLGAFAVLGCVARGDDEAQTFDDIAGLGIRQPVLGAILLVSVLSLVGLPPMIGFLGKIYIFSSAIQHGYICLVVIAVLNSAVSAVYYLRIISACYFLPSNQKIQVLNLPARLLAGGIAAVCALALGIAGSRLVDAAHQATDQHNPDKISTTWRADLADPSIRW